MSAKSFVAGAAAGAAGTFVGHPLDTLKTHVQAGSRPPCMRALFRGVSMPVLTAGVLQSINLGVYENVCRLVCGGRHESFEAAPLWCHGLAATVGGIAISPLTAPLSRIKVQQQLGGASFAATVRASAAGGTLYIGYAMTLAFESSRGFYMVVYQGLKRAFERHAACHRATPEPAALPLWMRTIAGATANIAVWAVFYPVDVVRSVQQSAPPRPPTAAAAPAATAAAATAAAAAATMVPALDAMAAARAVPRPAQPRSALACARALIAEAGIARLYRGYTVTILRAGPGNVYSRSNRRTRGTAHAACMTAQSCHSRVGLHAQSRGLVGSLPHWRRLRRLCAHPVHPDAEPRHATNLVPAALVALESPFHRAPLRCVDTVAGIIMPCFEVVLARLDNHGLATVSERV